MHCLCIEVSYSYLKDVSRAQIFGMIIGGRGTDIISLIQSPVQGTPRCVCSLGRINKYTTKNGLKYCHFQNKDVADIDHANLFIFIDLQSNMHIYMLI